MVRDFTDEPVDAATIDRLVDLARRAPSAGNAQGCRFLVLDQPGSVARYWDTTLPEPRRASFRWPGLVTAPVLIVVAVRPQAYVERYAEPDKAATGLGTGEGEWPVPYWWVDAGAAVEHLLLGAVDAGLGACLFGLFEHEAAVAESFGIGRDEPHHGGWRLVATIALGHPAPSAPGRSAGRTRRSLDEVLRRNRW
jgi:nitroreductase